MVEAIEIDIIALLLVLTLAWVFGLLAQRVGYPALMGELVAGILFGPALLGLLEPAEGLRILAELGIFLLMVYVGLEDDLHELFEAGPQSLVVAFGGFVVPFGLGYGAGILVGLTANESLFVGMAMAATSLATKSRILVDLDLLDTRIADVLLGGALLADVGVLIAFTAIMGFIEVGSVDPVGITVVLVKVIGFFVVAIIVGDRILPQLWDVLETLMDRHGFVDKTSAFTIFLIVSLVFAVLAVLVDLHMIIGGFMAGLYLKQADIREPVFDHIYNVTYDLAIGVFAPIFFVTVGFNLSLAVFSQDLVLLVLFVAVAFIGKIIGTWVFAIPTALTSREGFVIGLGMNGRGAVEIIIASIGLSAGVIDKGLFSILVFIAIFTTALVPPTMQWGIKWLERSGQLVRTGEGAKL